MKQEIVCFIYLLIISMLATTGVRFKSNNYWRKIIITRFRRRSWFRLRTLTRFACCIFFLCKTIFFYVYTNDCYFLTTTFFSLFGFIVIKSHTTFYIIQRIKYIRFQLQKLHSLSHSTIYKKYMFNIFFLSVDGCALESHSGEFIIFNSFALGNMSKHGVKFRHSVHNISKIVCGAWETEYINTYEHFRICLPRYMTDGE